MSEEIVVVVSGGEPPDPRAALGCAARRARRRRRQGARARARARPRGDGRGRRLRLRVAGSRRGGGGRRDVASSGTRTRRTRPISSSRSTWLPRWTRSASSCSAGDGGRLDHLLAALLLLGSDRYAGVAGRCARRRRARSRRSRRARARRASRASSSRCSPLHGPAEGVTTEGLAYPLRGETLAAGLEPRRLERLRRADARASRVERGVLLGDPPGRRG